MKLPDNLPSRRAVVIIIVDDDRAVRNSLKFSLEVEGFAVRAYACAADLLASPDHSACACFVIDQNMPEMTGLDLIAGLRQRQISVPAVLITTHPSAALVERAKGADIRIIEKPLLGNALLDTIHAACTQHNRAQQ